MKRRPIRYCLIASVNCTPVSKSSNRSWIRFMLIQISCGDDTFIPEIAADAAAVAAVDPFEAALAPAPSEDTVLFALAES